MNNYLNEKTYIIQCQSDSDLLWCNEFGWIDDLSQADKFSEFEKDTLNLPIEGQWVEPHQYFKRDNYELLNV
jgi:hypothetical protein